MKLLLVEDDANVAAVLAETFREQDIKPRSSTRVRRPYRTSKVSARTR